MSNNTDRLRDAVISAAKTWSEAYLAGNATVYHNLSLATYVASLVEAERAEREAHPPLIEALPVHVPGAAFGVVLGGF